MALRSRIITGSLMLCLAGCAQIRAVVPGLSSPQGAVSTAPPAGAMRATLFKTGQTLILTQRDRRGAVTTWSSAEGHLFSFRDGVLIETRGLGADLMSSDGPSLSQIIHGSPSEHMRRYFYVDRNDQIGRSEMRCSQTHDSAGEIRETCRDSQREIRNIYSLQGHDAARTREWVSPFFGYVQFERISTR